VGPVPAPVTVQELPTTEAAPVAKRALPDTPEGAVESKKLAGQFTVIFWLEVNAVARVKVTVAVWVAAVGARLETENDTPVTWPPSAGTVLLEPTLLMSLLVETQKEEPQGCRLSAVDPMVAVKTRLCAPATGVLEPPPTIQTFTPPEVDVVAQLFPPLTAGVLDAANKPAGHVMVTEPVGRAVARVKATVTSTPAFPGTLLPPVSDAAVTCPPIAGAETPADTRSTELETVTLPGFTGCAAPVDHALLKTTVTGVFAGIEAVPVVITILVLAVDATDATVVVPAIVVLVTAMVPAKVNKFAGKLMVKVVPEADGLTVPVLNATVKTLAVAGKVSAIVKVTPEICPPRAPEVAPALTKSVSELTVMPQRDSAKGAGPIWTPAKMRV